MSKIISFRINPDNLRELQGEEIIEAWQKAGYSTRHIIIEALLLLGEPGSKHRPESLLEKLDNSVSRLSILLEKIESVHGLTFIEENRMFGKLPDKFLESIRTSSKAGMRPDK